MATTPTPFDGGGPGGHPGVTTIMLTNDPTANNAAIETLLEAGAKPVLTYTVASGTFAVFASGYKQL